MKLLPIFGCYSFMLTLQSRFFIIISQENREFSRISDNGAQAANQYTYDKKAAGNQVPAALLRVQP